MKTEEDYNKIKNDIFNDGKSRIDKEYESKIEKYFLERQRSVVVIFVNGSLAVAIE